MLSIKTFQATAAVLAVVGFGFAAPDAAAGSCSSNQPRYYHGNDAIGPHSRSHVNTRYGNSNFRISFEYGSYGHRQSDCRSHQRRGYGYGYGNKHVDYRHVQAQPRYSQKTVCKTKTVRTSHGHSRGYWSRVYVPPVYETRYTRCGTPYRVCVQDGYYKRVWVSRDHRY